MKQYKLSLRWRGSLSQQILTGLGLSVAFVGFLALGITYKLIQADFRKQVEDRAQSLVRSLEFATEGLIELNNTSVLQRVVQNYATLNAVDEITLVNPDGSVLAHNRASIANQTYDLFHPELTAIWTEASETGIEISKVMMLNKRPVLVYVMPFSGVLFGNSGKRGVTIAIMDLRQMQADVRHTFWTALIALSAGLLAILVLMWLLLQNVVLHPLHRLNRAVAEGGEQGLFELPRSLPNNEINFLAITFSKVFKQRSLVEAALRESEESERAKTLELQQILAELRQTQTQLIQTEKMSSLGQLVAGIAHEINNPVNFIHGNLTHTQTYVRDLMELIETYQQSYPQPALSIQDKLEEVDFDFLKQDFPKLLKSMRFGTERIREIIISLRTFSRLDEAELKASNLHENIDSTLTILQHRFKAKSSSSSIEIIKDYTTLPSIYCYPGPLNQVFMNLLSNAIDALEHCDVKQPQIRIRTQRLANHWVAIHIADNGPGMSEAVKSKLFEPFFTTKPVGKGTGLGLAISYQIVVERHGGMLSCQSQLGQGTEFIIEIPTGYSN
jgi:two-component system NtrC family sensor kinase